MKTKGRGGGRVILEGAEIGGKKEEEEEGEGEGEGDIV